MYYMGIIIYIKRIFAINFQYRKDIYEYHLINIFQLMNRYSINDTSLF